MSSISPEASLNRYTSAKPADSAYSKAFAKNSSNILNFKREIIKIAEQGTGAPLPAELFDVVGRVEKERSRFQENIANYANGLGDLSEIQNEGCIKITQRVQSDLSEVCSFIGVVSSRYALSKCLSELDKCIGNLDRISKLELKQKNIDDFMQVMTRIKGIQVVLSKSQLTEGNKSALTDKLEEIKELGSKYQSRIDVENCCKDLNAILEKVDDCSNPADLLPILDKSIAIGASLQGFHKKKLLTETQVGNVNSMYSEINSEINKRTDSAPDLKAIVALKRELSKVSSKTSPKDLAKFFTRIEPNLTVVIDSIKTSKYATACGNEAVKVLEKLFELEKAHLSSIDANMTTFTSKFHNEEEYNQIKKQLVESDARLTKLNAALTSLALTADKKDTAFYNANAELITLSNGIKTKLEVDPGLFKTWKPRAVNAAYTAMGRVANSEGVTWVANKTFSLLSYPMGWLISQQKTLADDVRLEEYAQS